MDLDFLREIELLPSLSFEAKYEVSLSPEPQTAASFCLRFDLVDCERVVLVFVKLLRTCALRLDPAWELCLSCSVFFLIL